MPEATGPEYREREPRPLWQYLFDIQNLIDKEMKRVDASGSDFLAKDELLHQLRIKYKWYEKWASTDVLDRQDWVKRHKDNRYGTLTPRLVDLAEENYKIAINAYAQEGEEIVLEKIENDTIEDSAKELEKIKSLIGTVDIKQVSRKFLAYISEFKKQVIYRSLTEDDRDYLDAYTETIEAEIDDRDTLKELLPQYVDTIVNILRAKKK